MKASASVGAPFIWLTSLPLRPWEGASILAKLYPCFFTTAVMVPLCPHLLCVECLKHHDGCHTQLGESRQGHGG